MRPRTILIIVSFFTVSASWLLLRPKGVKAPPADATTRQVVSQPGATNTTPNSSSAKQLPPDQLTPKTQIVEEIVGALTMPITFYGRVLDQHDDPVADALVNYTAMDKFDAPGTQYQGRSDADGYFALSGISGAVLSVGVRKEGYYMIDGKSAHSFAYGVGTDSTRQKPPTRADPAIFLLQKMGPTEPLIRISTGGIKVAKDGTAVSIDLATGRKISIDSRVDGLRVEAWTQNQSLDPEKRYNWRCRVSVPGGGLLECKEQFDFEAPESGYRKADEIVMAATDVSWKRRVTKCFFAQLPSGRYARLQFMFTSAGDHFFTVESHLNPTPGSRNLEFDPKKTLKPHEATRVSGKR
jgi:hypothetical protein